MKITFKNGQFLIFFPQQTVKAEWNEGYTQNFEQEKEHTWKVNKNGWNIKHCFTCFNTYGEMEIMRTLLKCVKMYGSRKKQKRM